MIIVSYDFMDDKKRTKFSKFLEQYGERVQYSVFIIKNSQRILKLVLTEIEEEYSPNFDDTDHILVFETCRACDKKIRRYGSAEHEEEDVIYFGR